jgi:glycosyltransferase involved in cell wall biosynthesis
MRIFGWQVDHSGCFHYRLKLPFDHLVKLGHDAFYGPDLARVDLDGVDVVVGQRVTLPGPTRWWQAAAKRGDHLLVYETDDDLAHIDPGNTAALAFMAPDLQASYRRNLAVANLVTVSTEHLAEVVSEFTSAPIVVLPNRIPRWLTEHVPTRRDDVVTVGWAGSTSHAVDWEEASSAVRRFVTRTPGVELHTFGMHHAAAGRRSQVRGAVHDAWANTRHSPWEKDLGSFLRALDFHVGLAPLRPSVFNRSKSAVKTLEYAALGIPAVASNTGPYPGFVEDGVTGLLVDRPYEWGSALRTLTFEPLREQMGAAARDVARRHLIEDHAQDWVDAYEKAS